MENRAGDYLDGEIHTDKTYCVVCLYPGEEKPDWDRPALSKLCHTVDKKKKKKSNAVYSHAWRKE